LSDARGKVFVDFLGMGEAAPPFFAVPSATPPPYVWHGHDMVRHGLMTSGSVMFADWMPYDFKGLYVRAVNALHCVCLYVHWRQWHGGFVYSRGLQLGKPTL
jgi:hypothetical protein